MCMQINLHRMYRSFRMSYGGPTESDNLCRNQLAPDQHQQFKSCRVDKQTYKQTNRHYWKQTNYRCAGGNKSVKQNCLLVHPEFRPIADIMQNEFKKLYRLLHKCRKVVWQHI